MNLRTDLLSTIEAFLEETGMEPSTFGRTVLSDPNFVFELRAGRSPNTRTLDRIGAYLSSKEQNKNNGKGERGNRK